MKYPETSNFGAVGHLFNMAPDNWVHPRLSFLYSQGAPEGSQSRGPIYSASYWWTTTGWRFLVGRLTLHVCFLIYRSHSCNTILTTCPGQGCKICPFVDLDSLRHPYTCVNRQSLKQWLQDLQVLHTPRQVLFSRTLSLFRAYRALGCLGPTSQDLLSPFDTDHLVDKEWDAQMRNIWRGHDPRTSCGGHILLEYDKTRQAFVR